jgi:SAM-dependent methyltransferase
MRSIEDFDPTAFVTPRSFGAQSAFYGAFTPGTPFVESIEAYIRAQPSVVGYCHFCGRTGPMKVDGGPNFGKDFPNTREGLVCACGSNNRERLMLLATGRALLDSSATAFFGVHGCWPAWARQHCPSVTFCEYFGQASGRGQFSEVLGYKVRSEDLTALSFDDASLDLIVHADVLEHIPDVPAVFAESFRALRPGGRTIFTAPFFQARAETVVRAVVEDGQIRHQLPPEMHGDPLSPNGILAFYNFGWSLLDMITASGFATPSVNLIYAPELGVVSNGCPYPERNMLPVYVVAEKGGTL